MISGVARPPPIDVFGRAAGLAAFVWIFGQAGGDVAKEHGGIDVGTASIVCAAIAGIVAVTVAFIGRPRPKDSDVDESDLVKLALLVALRGHDAEKEGDEPLADEQRELGKHLSAELERRRRGPE